MSDSGVDGRRRRLLTTATSAIGGIGAAFIAVPFVKSWTPSARAEATGGPVEVNVGALAPGARLTVVWRGRPVWVIRRTEAMLGSLEAVRGKLRDPDSSKDQQPPYCVNPARSIKPEFLVMIGLCTHLGCLPDYRPDGAEGELEFPGFFCACHGSQYDIAGRVYSGVPAPLNMMVPPYRFESEKVAVIGEDPKNDEVTG